MSEKDAYKFTILENDAYKADCDANIKRYYKSCIYRKGVLRS